ncbi:hypothetical protein N8368_04845 [Bacteroidia bacterium]|nr:hypothetical protein [Bacteroidia bacterium]MDC1395814.1 hypothetical protein [Bacteroidia bacterium]
MKLNKDNYELVMFDLLEGNLSERDELLVMEQIEGDESLFREWKLVKSTILIADKEVTYYGKESLLKRELVTVVPMFTKWMAVAASICILAAVIVFWPQDKPTEIADTGKKIEVPLEKVTPDIQEPLVDDFLVQVEVENPQVTPNVNKVIRRPNVVEKQSSIKDVAAILAIKEAIQNIDEKQLSKHYEEIQANKLEVIANQEKEIISEREPSIEDNKIEPILLDEPEVKIVFEYPMELNSKQKVKLFVTNNSPRRIKEKAITFIAKVSNPKIRLKPNFKSKRPSLEIELETAGYQATASIQPFKNRNN